MAFNQCYINLSLKKKRMPLGLYQDSTTWSPRTCNIDYQELRRRRPSSRFQITIYYSLTLEVIIYSIKHLCRMLYE